MSQDKSSNSKSDLTFSISFEIDVSEKDIVQSYEQHADAYEKRSKDIGYTSFKYCIEAFEAAVKNKQADDSAKAMRILDIGAGTGLLGALLKELGYINVDAIDCTEAMLQKAKERNVYQKMMLAFVDEKKNEDIKDGEYDAMISSAAISAPQIQARAFDEMLRWLRAGGLFCFNIRKDDVDNTDLHYGKKFQELENHKKWKLISKEEVVHYRTPGDQQLILKKAYTFVYQKV